MWNLGLISFATPWVLAAAAALPIVWLLLRLTPPAVRQINFPAVRLLFGLDPTQRTSAHTPPWLILLRLAILILALLGLSDPILNLKTDGSSKTSGGYGVWSERTPYTRWHAFGRGWPCVHRILLVTPPLSVIF